MLNIDILSLVVIVIILVVLVAAWLLGWVIASPLNKSRKKHGAGAETTDEVGQLFSRVFNTLAKNLNTTSSSIETLHKEIAGHKLAEDTLKRAKIDLEKAYQQLQEAFEMEKANAAKAHASNAAKSRFIANVSHEIRTPLAGIIGICDLLIDTKMSKEQLEYAKIINSSADSLLDVINSTLDWSKIEAGRIELESIGFNLGAVVKDAIKVLTVKASQKKLELINYIGPNVPLNLQGDPGRLRQILVNLIGNAVKFTQEGTISVSVEVAAEEGKEQGANAESAPSVHLRFAVHDTGIGIPDDKVKLLFSPFSQVDASTARNFGGTGLGLAISRGLVEQMGGTIGVESEHGLGSTFWFIIPFSQQRADVPAKVLEEKHGRGPQKHEQYRSEKSLRILVAEDNLANQKVALTVLGKMGHSASAVANGMKAVEALEMDSYDLVLMDMQMPEMDGLEATAVIRDPKSRVLNHDIPILALTARVMEGDREKCLAAGMNDYIAKPIKMQSIASAIANLSSSSGVVVLKDERIHEKDPDTVFDSKTFSARMIGDLSSISDVINTYLSETRGLIHELEQAVKNRHQEKSTQLAHNIKGGAATVSGNKLSSLAIKLQRACEAANWPDAESLLTHLHGQFEILELAMREYLKKAADSRQA
jgi:signal transduction histidine kinase/CheY-like chemotaxis protein/HPt (histidine-containing phosphotransfer) domain-containing protein